MTEFVCPICSKNIWDVVYSGPVRDGEFSKTKKLQKTVYGDIIQCHGCTVQKLASNHILKIDDYKSNTYRSNLNQKVSNKSYSDEHAAHLEFVFNILTKFSKINETKKVADIGAASGAILELISASKIRSIAIEPNHAFGQIIAQKGYQWYQDTEEALVDHAHTVDLAVSAHVIEHVDDPKQFLKEIYKILGPGGELFLTTPNRNDVLMKICPDDFPPFFYRTQHNWYFDKRSLETCAKLAGFERISIGFEHKYPIVNAVTWSARASKNTLGSVDVPDSVNDFWKNYLQSTGEADTLVLTARKPKGS